MVDRSPATLQDLLAGMARHGGAAAIVAFTPDGVRTLSYAELHRRSLSLAGGLMGRGLAPGTPVALFAANGVPWIVCRLALIAADLPCVPVDFDADAARLAALLRDSGARLIFTTPDLLATARAACADLEAAAEIILLADARPGDGTDLPTADEIAGAPPAALPRARPDAPVARFYTSGTTGPPKAVPLTHRNIMTNASVLLGLGVLRREDRVALPLPLHHSYPFIVGMVLPLSAGATIVLPAGVSGPLLLRALREGGATLLVGVPRLYEALVAAIDTRLHALGVPARAILRLALGLSMLLRRRFGLRVGRLLLAPLHRQIAPTLRSLICGGARLEAAVEWRLEALGWRVLTGYGSVETTSVATFNHPGLSRVGSAGQPSPVVELRLVPVEGLDHSEIQFRGPIVFSGYPGHPAANAEAFTADGWFRTGDLGWRDGDGFLFIAGRSKEMIVLPDGKNVAPEEVEAVYGRSPYVREIAVLEHGGKLVAVVVPDLAAAHEAATGRLGDELRVSFGALGTALPRYMRVADFVTVRDPLPRNQLGKYLRHRLEDLYTRAGRGERRAARAAGEQDRALMAQPRAAAVLGWLHARFPEHDIDPDTSLHMDLEIDSLSWLDLSLDLERRVDVTLTEDAIARLVTVRDLLVAVERAPQRASVAGMPPQPADEAWLAERSAAGRRAGRLLHGIARLIARGWLRLTVEGGDRVPLDRPVVIAANHESDIDPLVLAAALPRPFLRRAWWGADARRVFGSRAGRALARAVNMFPVDDHAPAASIERAVKVVTAGGALIWFPEEWRSPDGEMLPFRSGIGAIVARTGATVVPAHIEGTYEIMPRDTRLPRRGRVRVRFGAPLPASALVPPHAGPDARESYRVVAQKLQDAVVALAGAPPPQTR